MVFDRGVGIYRSVILALAGLALLGANPVSYDARGNPSAAQGDKSANQEKDVASGISRIGEALEAQNAKTDPYEKERNEREIRDLQAQENSAYWAESMFWATFAALVLSFIGVALVWTTFRETRKANEILEGDQRPWIDVEISEISMSSSKESFDITASIVLKNIGRTPAFNVWSRARIATGVGQINEKFSEFAPNTDRGKPTHDMLPGAESRRKLHPTMPSSELAWVSVHSQGELIAGPYFFPHIQLKIEYEWGKKRQTGVTVKNFAISAVPKDHPAKERVSFPITLGEMPVTELKVFEVGVADIS